MIQVWTRLQDEGWNSSGGDCGDVQSARKLVRRYIKGPLGSSCMYWIVEVDPNKGRYRILMDNDECFAMASGDTTKSKRRPKWINFARERR